MRFKKQFYTAFALMSLCGALSGCGNKTQSVQNAETGQTETEAKTGAIKLKPAKQLISLEKEKKDGKEVISQMTVESLDKKNKVVFALKDKGIEISQNTQKNTFLPDLEIQKMNFVAVGEQGGILYVWAKRQKTMPTGETKDVTQLIPIKIKDIYSPTDLESSITESAKKLTRKKD